MFGGGYGQGSGLKTFFNVFYIIIGLYLINTSFGFIPLPEFVLGIESWIFLIGGAIIILGVLKKFFFPSYSM